MLLGEWGTSPPSQTTKSPFVAVNLFSFASVNSHFGLENSNQSASETQIGESVLVGDSQAATNADNNTASLGVNSPDYLSLGKYSINN